MRKLFLVALIVAMASAFVFASGGKEAPAEKAAAPRKTVLACVCKVMDNPWFQATASAFKAKELELGASEVLLLDS